MTIRFPSGEEYSGQSVKERAASLFGSGGQSTLASPVGSPDTQSSLESASRQRLAPSRPCRPSRSYQTSASTQCFSMRPEPKERSQSAKPEPKERSQSAKIEKSAASASDIKGWRQEVSLQPTPSPELRRALPRPPNKPVPPPPAPPVKQKATEKDTEETLVKAEWLTKSLDPLFDKRIFDELTKGYVLVLKARLDSKDAWGTETYLKVAPKAFQKLGEKKPFSLLCYRTEGDQENPASRLDQSEEIKAFLKEVFQQTSLKLEQECFFLSERLFNEGLLQVRLLKEQERSPYRFHNNNQYTLPYAQPTCEELKKSSTAAQGLG